MPEEQVPLKTITLTLQFQAIDTGESILDCDGCTRQAKWIAFAEPAGRFGHKVPALVFCDDCLVKLEQYAKTRLVSHL